MSRFKQLRAEDVVAIRKEGKNFGRPVLPMKLNLRDYVGDACV